MSTGPAKSPVAGGGVVNAESLAQPAIANSNTANASRATPRLIAVVLPRTPEGSGWARMAPLSPNRPPFTITATVSTNRLRPAPSSTRAHRAGRAVQLHEDSPKRQPPQVRARTTGLVNEDLTNLRELV